MAEGAVGECAGGAGSARGEDIASIERPIILC